MSKKITITFYNPKELWEMFWDRFFWPRRKQCAEWCEFGRYQMEEEIMSEVLDKVDKVLEFLGCKNKNYLKLMLFLISLSGFIFFLFLSKISPDEETSAFIPVLSAPVRVFRAEGEVG